MQGVIIAPIFAAILAVLVTGKTWAGAAAFIVVLALAATGVVGQFRRHD